MSRLVVDVAVVGRELSGLAGGALCARAGRRVVVVVDDDQPGRVLGDRLAPLAPSLWRMPHGGPVGAVFDDLGLRADARRILGEPVGVGVVDDPDLRCVFAINDETRARELGRCFGDAGRVLADTLQKLDVTRRHPALLELRALHEDGWFFEARRARNRVTALGSVGAFDAVDDDVSALWGDGYGIAPVLPQLASFVQHRARVNERGLASAMSLATLQGGTLLGSAGAGLGPRAAVADLLLGFIKSHGGEVISDRVASVDAVGRKVTGLRTDGKREIIATAFIDATSARDLVDRLPGGRPREKVLTQQGKVVIAGGATSVRWLLPVRVLPRGLPPVFVILGSDGAPPVLVGLYPGSPTTETGKASHLDEHLLCVVATAPGKDPAPIEAALERVLPFASGAARAKDVVDASAVCGHYDIKESEHALGGRRPRTAFKNLVRAGRDLAPAWGLDGELVAARSAAALIDRCFPKPPRN